MNEPVLDTQAIMALLPHRYPVLLVDQVIELEPGERIIAVKNVTANEPHFTGHYPHPLPLVMPASLMVEAASQAVALMFLTQEGNANATPALTGLKDFRFKRPVVPGDQLVITATATRVKMGVFIAETKGEVQGDLAFEGTLSGSMLKS